MVYLKTIFILQTFIKFQNNTVPYIITYGNH